MSRLREDQRVTQARQPHNAAARCYQGAMSSGCRECLAGLEHCHGTVIHHAWYGTECTEDGCVTPEVVHTFSVDCDAVGCTCTVRESAHRVG